MPYFIKLHRNVDALVLFFVIYITELLITLEMFTSVRFRCILMQGKELTQAAFTVSCIYY